MYPMNIGILPHYITNSLSIGKWDTIVMLSYYATLLCVYYVIDYIEMYNNICYIIHTMSIITHMYTCILFLMHIYNRLYIYIYYNFYIL